MKKNQIGERLRTIRMIKGETLTCFSKKLKLTPAGLSQLENGKRKPSYNTLMRVISILKIDPRFLFS